MSQYRGHEPRHFGALPWTDRAGSPQSCADDILVSPGLAWQLEAACQYVDTELFYPPDGANPHEAYRICGGCPVRVQCLEYALSVEEEHPTTAHGVWGGVSGRQRQKILARRRGGRPLRQRKPRERGEEVAA